MKKMRTINITNSDTGDSASYQIAFGTRTLVTEGQLVGQGQALTEGDMAPADILRVSGLDAVYDYILREVQRVYRMQSIDVNDKHIEVIARQMTRKVNEKLQARIDAGERDIRLATGAPVLLGITKASIQTNSFLSAASFQETTKVLTEAAIKGKVDHLLGLKENVLIGKLIPAGTGMERYRNVEVECIEPEPTEEELAARAAAEEAVAADAEADTAEAADADTADDADLSEDGAEEDASEEPAEDAGSEPEEPSDAEDAEENSDAE